MLADLPPDDLQAVLARCDPEEFFQLRQVSRRLRAAVNRQTNRIKPDFEELASEDEPSELAARFRSVEALDCSRAAHAVEAATWACRLVAQLPHLRELLNFDFRKDDIPAEGLTTVTALRLIGGLGGRWFEPWDLSGIAVCFPSLRRLDLGGGLPIWATVQAEVARLSETLTELDLSGTKMDETNPLELQSLNTGKLESLSLAFVRASPATYSQIAAFTSLRCLDLAGNKKLRDDDVAHLQGLTRLESLDLATTKASHASLRRLGALTCLRHLSIRGAPFCKPDIGPDDFYHFEADGAQYEPWNLQELAELFPGLESLEASGDDITRPEDVRALAGLTRLVVNEMAVRMDDVSGLVRLRHLELRSTSWDASSLRDLSDLTALSNLQLEDPQNFVGPPCALSLSLSAPDLAPLSSLHRLRELRLAAAGRGGISLAPGALQQLAQLPALAVLDICSTTLEAPEELRLLERLRLRRLLLPHKLAGPERLPAGLRLAMAKAQRHRDW